MKLSVRAPLSYSLALVLLAVLFIGRHAGAQQLVAPPPAPKADCGPGSNPETGLQGRVSREEVTNGRAAEGYTCNMQEIGHFGKRGGYKVERYIDAAGHECAFYDSTLLFPKDAVQVGQTDTGVYVLDMTDPSNPVRTELLDSPAMQSPHESMALNQTRGLIAAVTANPVFYPGFIDVWDASQDCRHPVLRASAPVAGLGHEGNWAPDGKTYYSASLDGGTVTAVDLTNPAAPTPLWVGNHRSHGLSISDDGNHAYLAARSGLIILDVSQVQRRVPNPQVPVVSTLTWPIISTPQMTIPVTIAGHPYLIEMDEFARDDGATGAARIIDLADEKNPKIVSDIRLEVGQPEYRDMVKNDPGAGDGVQDGLQGYAGHYCEVPRRHDPELLACTFILSGIRLFDIRDPLDPREIAYWNGPAVPAPTAPTGGTGDGANYAMSKPAIVSERGEIWYSDGNKGFYSLRVTNGVWPFGVEKCPRIPLGGLNHVVGSVGKDVLRGTRGDDVLCGLAGRDRIKGRGGDDLIFGGTGRDSLFGGQGRDRCHGGAERDQLARSCEDRSF
ncbi:MAG: LVIVD repeat-containing protein [Actinomycetota bacterium]